MTDMTRHNRGYLIGLSVVSCIFCTLLLLANLGSLVFNFYVIGFCPYKYCNYFCAKNYGSHDLFDALIRTSIDIPFINNTNDTLTLLGGIQPENNAEYYNWNKVVISSATVSGFLSYYMIIFFVLIPVYTKCCRCFKDTSCIKVFCTSWHLAFKNKEEILLPFCDRKADDGNTQHKQSTVLIGSQKGFFLFFYCLNLLFYFSSLVVFIKIMLGKLKLQKTADITLHDLQEIDINETGLMCQFISQFCAIQSCFIFSKVAYGISNKCWKLSEEFIKLDKSDEVFQRYLWNMDKVGPWTNDRDLITLQPLSCLYDYRRHIFEPGNNDLIPNLKADAIFFTKQARFEALKEIDKNFIKSTNATIIPYSHWFAVHWFLFSITTFMSMAFLFETYIRYIYTHHPKSWQHADRDHVLGFTYTSLFCITHAFLFIYPCFRAALITKSRNDAIKEFANHRWIYLPLSIQNAFYNHLQAQDYGFKISLFCTNITFGFNLAFISIFIGMFGIIMKLSL